jgi:hypothetical protein
MINETEFEQKDIVCKAALMLLFEKQTAGEWLNYHHMLFQSVVIAPEDLPPIVNAHSAGVFYEFISLFGHTYQSLMDCQSELKILQ